MIVKKRLTSGKKNLSRTPRSESVIQLIEQNSRHLSFGWNLQQRIILPDRARDALAVADIVQIDHDDRQNAQSMEVLLDLESRRIQKRAQARTLQSPAGDTGTNDWQRSGFPRALRKIRVCIARRRGF